jgi:hypothetical protein
MGFDIVIPTAIGPYGGQGLHIGTNGGFHLGVERFGGSGNLFGGNYGSDEVGFDTRRGVFHDSASGSWSPWSQSQSWSQSDMFGSRGGGNYGDVFGNYQNNQYAGNVWGSYSGSQSAGNAWGYTNSNYSGNTWTGGNQWSSQGGDVFGNYGWSAGAQANYFTPPFIAAGGGNAYRWFG